jgi:hypothetical protein
VNVLAAKTRTAVIAALLEGTSVNAAYRVTGVARHTGLKLLKDMGCDCAPYHDSRVRNVTVRRVRCEGTWEFIGAKAKNVTPSQKAQGWGDVWTWKAIDADTKLTLSYILGDIAEAVEQTFGANIDYAMLVKIYGALSDSPESRYSPATCIGCRTGVLSGGPDPDYCSTSFVERSNLSMRMGMRRFTELINGFSKKLEDHGHMVVLCFVHCNHCRVHKTLRVTRQWTRGCRSRLDY